MFWLKKTEKEVKVSELKKQIKSLEEDRKIARENLLELQHKKKMEEEDLKHMLKIQREKVEIQTERKELDLEKKYITDAKSELSKYHEKIVTLLQDNYKDVKEMIFSEIIKKIPDFKINYNMGDKKE